MERSRLYGAADQGPGHRDEYSGEPPPREDQGDVGPAQRHSIDLKDKELAKAKERINNFANP